MRQEFILLNLVSRNALLGRSKLFLIILLSQCASECIRFQPIKFRHVSDMMTNIVLYIWNRVLNGVLVGLDFLNECLHLELWNFRDGDKKVCQQLELCLELIFLPNLVCGSVDMLRACINRTQNDSFKGSRFDILMMVELVQNEEWYYPLALRQQLRNIINQFLHCSPKDNRVHNKL